MPRRSRTIGALLLGALLLLLVTLSVTLIRQHRAQTQDAQYRAVQDSLTHVAAALHDTVIALGERYRVDTLRVRETTTVYRAAVAHTETTVVTLHGDTVRVDTLAPVTGLILTCTHTLAARDTALSVCEQRIAVARRAFAAESTQQARTITYLDRQRGRAAQQGRATGRRQGVVLTLLGLVGVGLAWHALPH